MEFLFSNVGLGLLPTEIQRVKEKCIGKSALKNLQEPQVKLFSAVVQTETNLNLILQDILRVSWNHTYSNTLLQYAYFPGVSFKSTAVKWGYNTKGKMLRDNIEVDESLIGRRVIHNWGNPNTGLKD